MPHGTPIPDLFTPVLLGHPLPYHMDTWDRAPLRRPVQTSSIGDPLPLNYLQAGGWPSTERPSCNTKLTITLSVLTVSFNFN